MTVLAALAAMIHGGTLFAFAVLLARRTRLPPVTEVDVVRLFRACGAILGLSLGVFILAWAWDWSVTMNPGAVGIQRWRVPPGERLPVALFGAYWVSYTLLEVWTLDPCRLLDRHGEVQDPAAYHHAAEGVARHVMVNTLLFSAVVALLAARS